MKRKRKKTKSKCDCWYGLHVNYHNGFFGDLGLSVRFSYKKRESKRIKFKYCPKCGKDLRRKR